MQAVFFKLAQVIPVDEAVLKDSIVKMYGKGEDIVKMNHAAVDNALEALVKVDVPQSWQDAADEVLPEKRSRILLRTYSGRWPDRKVTNCLSGAFTVWKTVLSARYNCL